VGLEGGIDVGLLWDGAAIRRVVVSSSRPLTASRVLEGRTWQVTEALVPRLFSVCGRAQAVAAAGAMEAARGVAADPAVLLGREWAIAAECLQEYAWRLFLDLPVLLGELAQPEPLAALRRELQPVAAGGSANPWWHAPAGEAELSRWKTASDGVSAWLAENVFGVFPAERLALDSLDGLVCWMEGGETKPARHLWSLWQSETSSGVGQMLARLSAVEAAAAFATRMLDEEFISAPEWGGAPAETGALGRLAHHSMVAQGLAARGTTAALRLLARLAEMAELSGNLARLADGVLDNPWHRNAALAPGSGFSVTETARGMLLHWVELEGDKVARYRILAPTEWNFHPRGALARGLEGQPAASEADALTAARLLIHSLDPCVGYRVQVSHA
jgi:uptake hydrogenase large subunit